MNSENHDVSRSDLPRHAPRPLHHSFVDARNPFHAATMTERDDNFPSFDQALWGGPSLNQSASSCASSVCLSISARAALNEHNRHVARYGIDDSFALPSHPPPHVETVPPMEPLDAEWDRLLSNASSVVNLSAISSSQSAHSMMNVPFDTDIRMTSTTIHPLNSSNTSEEFEGIEVIRSDLSVSDFFNTSKVFALRTPERSLHVSHSVMTRGGHQPNDSACSDKSEVSDLLSSRRIHQFLLSTAAASASPSPTASHRQHLDNADENSFLLSNADLSRISADGSDCNIDVSFNSFRPHLAAQNTGDALVGLEDQCSPATEARQQQQCRPQPLPFFDVGLSTSPKRRGRGGCQLSPRRSRVQRPLTQQHISGTGSNSPHGGRDVSKIRPTLHIVPSHPAKQKSTSPSISINSSTSHHQLPPMPNRRQRSPNESFSSHMFGQEALAILELSPIPKPRSATSYTTSQNDGKDDDSDCDDARLEMLGLSPISKRAAESAMHVLQSGGGWKASVREENEFATKLSALGPSREFEQTGGSASHSIEVDDLPFDLNFSLERTEACPEVLVYENRRNNSSREDDISLLQSNSSVKKTNSSNDTSNSPEVTNRSDVKVSSLSSITPNSSSEHHLTTNLAEAPTQIDSSHCSLPPNRQQMSKSMNSLEQRNKTLSLASESMHPWNANDRRRYRSVVPFRVFLSEPDDFPEEDDSFSIAYSRLVAQRESRSTDSCSVPNERRRQRLCERSFLSSPL